MRKEERREGKELAHVIDVMKHISPKDIQHLRADEEAANAHPQAISEGGQRKGDDKVGKQGGHEHDKGFPSEEVEEQPHDPGEEGAGGGAEVVKPVSDEGEDEGDEDCGSFHARISARKQGRYGITEDSQR